MSMVRKYRESISFYIDVLVPFLLVAMAVGVWTGYGNVRAALGVALLWTAVFAAEQASRKQRAVDHPTPGSEQ